MTIPQNPVSLGASAGVNLGEEQLSRIGEEGYDLMVGGNKVNISSEQLEAAKGKDVLSPYLATDAAGNDVTGFIMIKKQENGSLSVIVSLDPSSPALTSPENTIGGKEQQSWFGGFLVIFTMLMNEIAEMDKQNKFSEKSSELESRSAIWETSKNKAQLAIDMAEAQAQEKILEAVSHFVEASGAAINARSHKKNEKKAEEMANQEYRPKIDAKNAEIDAARAKVQDVRDNPPVGGQEAHARAKADAQAELGQKEAELNALNSEKQTSINQQVYRMDEVGKNMTNCVTSAAKAWLAYAGSLLKTREGIIQAEMALNDGISQQYQKSMDNSSTAYSQSTQHIESILQLLMRYQDSHGGKA